MLHRKAAVTSVEPAVVEAQEETTKAIGAEEDDGEGGAARPPPKPVLSSDDRYKLESAAKKARKAGNCVPQARRHRTRGLANWGYNLRRLTACGWIGFLLSLLGWNRLFGLLAV